MRGIWGRREQIALPISLVSPPSLILPSEARRTRMGAFSPFGQRVVVTDGGPHPPDVWAQISAEHLILIPEEMVGEERRLAGIARNQVQEALNSHHRQVQEKEKQLLAESPERLTSGEDTWSSSVDAALPHIWEAVRGTIFESHLADEGRQETLRRELARHFATAQHIERGWHLDLNPAHPLGSLFRVNHRPGVLDLQMAGYTTAMPTSFKGELPQAIHNFTITTGNVFKIALGKQGPTGTYGAASVNYSDLTGNSDEVPNGSGYTTGGFAWTAAQNITPATSGTGAYWQWSVNPNWTSATFSFAGCLLYNSSASNKAAYIGSLGNQSVTSGTVTLVQPTNGVGTSLLQLN